VVVGRIEAVGITESGDAVERIKASDGLGVGCRWVRTLIIADGAGKAVKAVTDVLALNAQAVCGMDQVPVTVIAIGKASVRFDSSRPSMR